MIWPSLSIIIPSSSFLFLSPLDTSPVRLTLRPLVHVIGASIATHEPPFITIILPSFNVITPSFNAVVAVADESVAAGAAVAGAAAAVSVLVVDALEPSLQANAIQAIDAINNNFFMMFLLVLIVRKTMPFIHSYRK